ncbi:hypothetical protein BpHYR1_045247 [Brachionus plicatilis]|uniref:Uncharacterized protein n=1 Tax=Brachionus plicatilis TaxID=10195 RepID=A0A3M7SGB5_BRAPC|nr:hypothetical protein BpHYR1_045247 [Brachionus plicatilis]
MKSSFLKNKELMVISVISLDGFTHRTFPNGLSPSFQSSCSIKIENLKIKIFYVQLKLRITNKKQRQIIWTNAVRSFFSLLFMKMLICAIKHRRDSFYLRGNFFYLGLARIPKKDTE